MSDVVTGNEAKRSWVSRVLGVTLPGGEATAEAPAWDAGVADVVPNGLSFAFRKARLEWAFARTTARSGLERLQAGLRGALKDHPQFAAMDQAIGTLSRALAGLDDRLDDTLDAALNTADPGKQAEHKKAAQAIIGEYQRVVDNDPLLVRMDDNPFMKVAVQAVLATQLAAMARELAA